MSLSVDRLTVLKAGKPVVEDVSLSVAPGRVTAVLGANGAGKSELVLAIAGMLKAVAGSVRVDGKDITNLGPDLIRRAGVAAVPEGHRVLTRLSVDDNLRAAGSILDTGLDEALGGVYAIFPELAERRSQIAGTLSGGQQQMVALGHALMSRPNYVLLDEMSLGLAPLVVNRLMQVVRDLAAEGTGVILIEQFTELALDIADYACVLNAGSLHFAGSASLLRSRPEVLNEAYLGG